MPNREQQPDLVLAIPQEPLDANQAQSSKPQTPQSTQEKLSPRFSRRSFLAGFAALVTTPIAATIADKLTNKIVEAAPAEAIQPASQGETLQSQEARPKEIEVVVEVTNYENLDMQVTGDGRAGALIKRPFGNGTQVNVALGGLDVSGTTPKLKLDVKNFPITIEEPRSIGLSETDPDRVVVVGKFKALITTGGFRTPPVEIQMPNNWHARGVVISPDNNYAYVFLAKGRVYGGGVLIYKFSNGSYADYPIKYIGTQPSGSSDGSFVWGMTKPYHVLENQPLYRSYGRLRTEFGYVELTLSPTGVEGKILNPQESIPTANPTQFFDSQNRNRVFHITSGGSDGVIFDNVDNVRQTDTIGPKRNLYSSDTFGVGIYNVAVDVTSGKFHLATVAESQNEQLDFLYRPFIEEGSLSAPMDMNQRRLMPTNGSWPNLLDPPNTDYRVFILTKDSAKYFVACFGNQGIRTLRVPNGQPTGTDGNWAIVSAQVTEHRVYVPVAFQNKTNASW